MKTMINKQQEKIFLLVGSTNVGKSTYFNHLTWSSSPVGNIERLTTSPIRGNFKKDKNIVFIDLPGINDLNFSSEDEQTSFDYLFNNDYDGIINILSVNTLKRDLLITLDLAEAGVLNLININMADELKGSEINILKLSAFFKVQVNLISSRKKVDINNSILPILTNKIEYPNPLVIKYNEKIEKFINEFMQFVPNHKLSKRFIIIQALENNQLIINFLKQNNVLDKFNSIKEKYDINQKDLESIIITKQEIVTNLINKVINSSTNVIEQKKLIKKTKREKILDSIFLNKYLAIPLFLLIIALIWFLTFYEYTGGWIQEKLAVDGLGALQTMTKDAILQLNSNSSLQAWFAAFVADGLMGGVFTIISFIPWIVILVFCITLLEQIGIMSRVCIAFDDFFEKFGLSGRSIVNIITGIGCNVPAILMAKNTNSKKEKVVSIMIAPFVSCSARIVVFGFLSQILISSDWTWAFNFAMAAFSVIFSLFVAYFFSNILFRKTTSIFITEIVKYHKPDFYIIVKKIIFEVWEFLKRVIIIIFICNALIWLLTYLGPVKTFYLNVNDTNAIQHSFLRYISIPFQILLYPLGLGSIWQLPISLITAFPAKEIAASNIDVLFGSITEFKDMINQLVLSKSIIISYLMFFSFYIPCLSTIVVMKKEIGKRYTFYNILTGLVLSWILSWVIFNISCLIQTFNNISIYAFNGSIILSLLILLVLLILNYQLKRYLMFYQYNQKYTILINKIIFYSIISIMTTLLLTTNVIMLTNNFFI